MRTKTSLIACTAWFETVTTTTIFTIKQTHEFGSSVSVIILDEMMLQVNRSYIKTRKWYELVGGMCETRYPI
jgi:hypothetical protein